jgi:DNA repair exonuclease SbcCD ATPase subunit
MNENQLIISLQFQLDSEKKTNSEYNILINEQQNEISKLKNKIESLEKELNKFNKLKNKIESLEKELNKIKELKQEDNDTFFRKVSSWIYRS